MQKLTLLKFVPPIHTRCHMCLTEIDLPGMIDGEPTAECLEFAFCSDFCENTFMELNGIKSWSDDPAEALLG